MFFYKDDFGIGFYQFVDIQLSKKPKSNYLNSGL